MAAHSPHPLDGLRGLLLREIGADGEMTEEKGKWQILVIFGRK